MRNRREADSSECRSGAILLRSWKRVLTALDVSLGFWGLSQGGLQRLALGLSRGPWQACLKGHIQIGLPTQLLGGRHRWSQTSSQWGWAEWWNPACRTLRPTSKTQVAMTIPESVSQVLYPCFWYILFRLRSCHPAHKHDGRAHTLSLIRINVKDYAVTV